MKIPNLPTPTLTDYVNATPNSSIGFYKGKCDVEIGGQRLALQATLFLNWHPAPRIQIQVEGPGEFAGGIESEFASFSVDCSIANEPIKVEGSNVHVDYQGTEPVTKIDGTVRSPIESGGGPFAALIVHFANLRLSGIDIVGGEWNGSELMWTGRREFVVDEWFVRLDAVPNHSQIMKRLSTDGGYSITHTATITRLDRKLFNFDEVASTIFEFDRFLSLVEGSSMNAFFQVGISQAGRPTWHLWTAPQISPWTQRNSWATSDHDKHNLLTAFEGFRTRLRDPRWKEVLLRSLEWYLDTNCSTMGTDGSIVLAQAALEMISWNTFTVEKSMSVHGFEKLPASDRLRLLLMDAQLPLEVPTCLIELSKKAKELNWPDAAEAISVVRNKIAHPNRKNLDLLGGMGKPVVDEVYGLTMFLFETVLLRQIEYKGTYRNRLSGKIEAFS